MLCSMERKTRSKKWVELRWRSVRGVTMKGRCRMRAMRRVCVWGVFDTLAIGPLGFESDLKRGRDKGGTTQNDLVPKLSVIVPW